MKNDFTKRYRDLETEVMATLRDAVNNSKYVSQFVEEKAIKTDIAGFIELTIINDRLTFLDRNGMQYSIFNDCSLEDLIHIINNL